MSEEEKFDDLFTIYDENGLEIVLRHVDTVEINGTYFLAFFPTDIDETDERYGLVILKAVDPQAGTDLVIPTDEETEMAFGVFTQRLYPNEEEILAQ